MVQIPAPACGTDQIDGARFGVLAMEVLCLTENSFDKEARFRCRSPRPQSRRRANSLVQFARTAIRMVARCSIFWAYSLRMSLRSSASTVLAWTRVLLIPTNGRVSSFSNAELFKSRERRFSFGSAESLPGGAPDVTQFTSWLDWMPNSTCDTNRRGLRQAPLSCEENFVNCAFSRDELCYRACGRVLDTWMF
jgi:hypothetical protein